MNLIGLGLLTCSNIIVLHRNLKTCLDIILNQLKICFSNSFDFSLFISLFFQLPKLQKCSRQNKT